MMTRNPPGAMMEATRDSAGARSLVELMENSRQSFMMTTAGGWGRQRPGWSTPRKEMSLSAMIFGNLSSLMIKSSALMPSMSATRFIDDRSGGEEEMLLSVSLIRSRLDSSRSEKTSRSAQAEADTRPEMRGPLPISTTVLGFGKESPTPIFNFADFFYPFYKPLMICLILLKCSKKKLSSSSIDE